MEIMIVLATLLTAWAVWAGLAGWIKRSGKQWYWKPVPAICASFAGMTALVVGAALGGYGNRVEPGATALEPVAVTPVPPMAPMETDVPVVEAMPAESIIVAPLQSLPPDIAKAPVSKPTLDIRPRQYLKELSKLVKELGFAYPVDPVMSPGVIKDGFYGYLGEYAGYMAVVSKDTGKIIELSGFGFGDGSPRSVYEIPMLGAAVMSAAIPEVSHEEMLEAIPELFDSGAKGVTDTLQYSVVELDSFGIWFTVEPLP